MRRGELTELRVRDLHVPSWILTISRAAVEVDPMFRPQGERFLVKPYPKGKDFRRCKLTAQIVMTFRAHARAERLDRNDLFFRWHHDPTQRKRVCVVPRL